MAYDENLAKRVDAALGRIDPPKLVDKKMFGGIGFLVQGNMACGVYQEKLIVRVGSEKFEQSLAQPGVSVFDITGRPMNGWVMVGADVFQADKDLELWVKQGVEFALTLPAK